MKQQNSSNYEGKNLLPNEKFVIAPYVLQNSELLKLDSVVRTTLLEINNDIQFIVYFKFKSRYQLYKVRNLISKEPNLLSKGVENGLFYVKFLVPKKYSNVIQYKKYTAIPLSEKGLSKTLNFWQKKNPGRSR